MAKYCKMDGDSIIIDYIGIPNAHIKYKLPYPFKYPKDANSNDIILSIMCELLHLEKEEM